MNQRSDRTLRRSRWPLLAVYTLLLLSLGSGTLAQAAPGNQPGRAEITIEYRLEWLGWDLVRTHVVDLVKGFHTEATGPQRLCSGQDAEINVVIQRHLRLGRIHVADWVPGGQVSATVADTSIVELTDPGQGVVVEIPPHMTDLHSVTFTVHAIAPGVTTLQFDVDDVGDPYFWGTPSNPRMQNAGTRGMVSKSEAPIVLPPPIPIEVSSCYEAYASALGDTWPVKDVCGLDDPFKLRGRINRNMGSGITQTSSSLIKFRPYPGWTLDPAGVIEHRGRYFFRNRGTIRAVSPAGPVSTNFLEIGSGEYIARDYSQVSPLSATQGPDIELTGSSSYCSMGFCSNTPYTGYKIQLVPLPSGRGDPCKRTE